MPLLARDFDSERRLGDRVEVLDLRRAVRDRHGRSGRGDVRSVRDLDDRGPGEVVRVARLRRRGRRPLRFERPVAREVPPELERIAVRVRRTGRGEGIVSPSRPAYGPPASAWGVPTGKTSTRGGAEAASAIPSR